VLVLIATLTIASATGLWRAGARRRAAATVSARVLETCVLLASELAAGRPAGAALARAADEWPPLGPAAEAGALGSDVPSSLRVLAGIEGAADLRLLAAAWEVAHRTGHGLAATVALVADDLRAAQATRRVVESELASARATARLVALLPLPVLVLGSGTGGDPLGFLFGTPLGLTCLGGGLGLGIAGLWWIEAIAAAVPGPRAHPGGW
jgi:tight adherence protein B